MRVEAGSKQQLVLELEKRTKELARVNDVLQSEISERRLITQVLRAEENHYKDLANLLPQTVYEADENGNLIFVNQRAFENFRYTQEDFDSGVNIIQMIAPQDRGRALEAFQKSLSGEEYGRGMELTAVRKDKTVFPAMAFSSPIVQGNQKIGVRGFIVDITEQKKKEEEIENSRKHLRALAAGRQQILENERLRISRVIHDDLGQMLAAVKIELSGVSKALPKKEKLLIQKVGAVLDLVDSMVRTVQKVCSELRPAGLDDLGLFQAMKWEAQEFQKRTGIVCEFRSSLKEPDLDRDYSINFFRIVQETLTNAGRHSGATRVRISLERDADNLVLKVVDNGTGITAHEISDPKSFGLLGMRERALLFGGKVDITGFPGQGTMVSVHIPLSWKK